MNWATVKVHEINLLELSATGMFLKLSMYAPLLILPISFTTAELQETYNGSPTKFTIKDFKTKYVFNRLIAILDGYWLKLSQMTSYSLMAMMVCISTLKGRKSSFLILKE
jgi:hypothetical protein